MSTVAIHGKADLTQSEVCRPDALDTLANAWRAGTGGLSPAAGLLAWYDWAPHLSLSPGKQRSLLEKGFHKQQRLARYVLHVASAHDCPTCIEPLEQDRHFAAPAWQQWWHNATTGVRGVSRHHENMVTFAGRQWLDMWSPSNFIWTNPEVLHAHHAKRWYQSVVRRHELPRRYLRRLYLGNDLAGAPSRRGQARGDRRHRGTHVHRRYGARPCRPLAARVQNAPAQ